MPTTGNIGIVDTYIFDPATNAGPGSPTCTSRAGTPPHRAGRRPLPRHQRQHHRPTHWADTPEVYDPATNTWTLLTGVSTSQIHEEEYPFSYLLPNGKVFTMGPDEDVTYILDVDAQTWTPVGAQRPAQRLLGHVPAGQDPLQRRRGRRRRPPTRRRRPPRSRPDGGDPSWQPTAPMANARVYHTLTMLADGQVLAVGGAANSDQTHITTGVLSTEIWNPATQTWSTGASMAAARNYHSTAVLMPDGSVLVAGGGHPNSCRDPGQFSSQFYSPSYLSNGPRPDDHVAPRPPRPTARRSRCHTPDAASIGPSTSCRSVRHAPARHEPALRAAELHRRRRVALGQGSRRRRPSPRPATTCSSSSTPRASRRWRRS